MLSLIRELREGESTIQHPRLQNELEFPCDRGQLVQVVELLIQTLSDPVRVGEEFLGTMQLRLVYPRRIEPRRFGTVLGGFRRDWGGVGMEGIGFGFLS